jgi:nitroreductase
LVTDKDTLTELGRIATQGSFIAQAPMAIVIVMEDAPRPQLDASRALQQMELMAWSEGLGTCFVGVRVEEQQKAVAALLNIPEGMELITILPFGYRPDGPRQRGTPRKPMEEIAHREKFGEKYVPA